MKVLKASAGSGKTYTLSNTYINLLLDSDDRYAYRHILAVTFTNKATAEMKARILRDLSEMSKTNPRARQILTDILHDYSAFAVSTIDKFFQQTLKAFSREIGQFASYQIELDRNSLIQESMDRILDNLSPDQKELVDWLRQSVMDKVEQGQRFSIDDGLYEIGALLKSEEHRELKEKYGIDDAKAYSKERLSSIRESCRKVISDFEEKAVALGLEVNHGEKIAVPGVRAMKKNPDLEPLFGKPYDIYCTALSIDRLVFSLGLAGEFYKGFDELLKEKNVMPLEDSNTILRDIIDGSDAPFVYEKLGVRYEHFLLDEFQDTSRIQWENFLPLLREGESKAEPGKISNLIVGDVKQSIYRWRDSDWKLLGEEVEKAFPGVVPKAMVDNWRSSRAVVGFNNRFFKFAAKIIETDIYNDVEQNVKSDEPQEGCVRVTFTDDQLEAVVASVNNVRMAEARWSDIAVLVRNRKEGADVAARLIKEGWPVISDDSLSLKSSVMVRRLVSLLSYMENPANTVGSFLAREMGVEFPDCHHSLLDLCEKLLRDLNADDPVTFSGETLFIQAFMDDLRNWVDANGNNLRGFLKHWSESDPYIGSPENADSIRVLTIHKSKGLEFPHVIFPFAEKVQMFKSGTHWCLLNGGGTPLGDTVTGIYPVSLSSQSEQSLFAEAFNREYEMQTLDNINVFYVALTRAAKSLHIIADIPSKKFRESLDKDKPEYKRFSEILYKFCSKSEDYLYGEPYDFSKMKRKAPESIEDFPASFQSIPLDGRLEPSEEAADFFGDDGVVGAAASARLCGVEMHKVLESVRTAAELPKDLNPGNYRLLGERIAAHPEWFTTGTVRNEVTIIGADGKEHRPDRVIIDGDEVFVLDYKFGAERKESYLWQVRRYINLYRKLGYKKVTGAVWYVPDDEVIYV